MSDSLIRFSSLTPPRGGGTPHHTPTAEAGSGRSDTSQVDRSGSTRARSCGKSRGLRVDRGRGSPRRDGPADSRVEPARVCRWGFIRRTTPRKSQAPRGGRGRRVGGSEPPGSIRGWHSPGSAATRARAQATSAPETPRGARAG
jgi:hypothetical protein